MLNFPVSLIITASAGHSTSQVPQAIHFSLSILCAIKVSFPCNPAAPDGKDGSVLRFCSLMVLYHAKLHIQLRQMVNKKILE